MGAKQIKMDSRENRSSELEYRTLSGRLSFKAMQNNEVVAIGYRINFFPLKWGEV